jgi:flagellar protein FliT
MNYHNTLSLYELVAEVTNQMLMAAKQQDWEKLTELEGSCSNYVEQLKTLEEDEPLTGDARARKLASIKQILADDREIRNLVSPWMFNAMLNSNHTENKLARTYGQ